MPFGVKRSEALILLSRDHHHALDVARVLGRADGSDLDEAVARLVRSDHEWIRSHVAGLGDEPGVERAHELGRRMHDHVRFEERRLFGMLEQRLSEDELLRLGTAVEEQHG
jgi:hypothetical protein